MFYCIDFDPPLLPKEAYASKLQFEHKAAPCKDGIHLRVSPNEEPEPRMLGKRRFQVYETHATEIDVKKRVKRVYLKASNNQLNGKSDTVILQPEVDMVKFIQSVVGDRFKGLKYYPPDLDLLRDLSGIKSEEVPQRTPMWFKLRGKVSGSKAYSLLGYWLPSPTTQVGLKWSWTAPAVFSQWQKANMRYGTLYENHVALAYLLAPHNRHKSFQEVGWVVAPKPYPPGWGASPDGLIHDPKMTWDQLPNDLLQQYSKADRKKFDITRGAAEFKTSKYNCKFEAYYLPQVYMEMISLDVVWCDLVKYNISTKNIDGVWTQVRTCKQFRIYRNKNTESWIKELLHSSLKHTHDLLRHVMTDPYQAIRDYLQEVAEDREYTSILIEEDGPIDTAIKDYETYRLKKVRGYLDDRRRRRRRHCVEPHRR